jgi:hypothetical protein
MGRHQDNETPAIFDDQGIRERAPELFVGPGQDSAPLVFSILRAIEWGRDRFNKHPWQTTAIGGVALSGFGFVTRAASEKLLQTRHAH